MDGLLVALAIWYAADKITETAWLIVDKYFNSDGRVEP